MPITTKIRRAQAPHSRYHTPNPVIAVYGRTPRACKLIRHGQSYVALTADDAFLGRSPIRTRHIMVAVRGELDHRPRENVRRRAFLGTDPHLTDAPVRFGGGAAPPPAPDRSIRKSRIEEP